MIKKPKAAKYPWEFQLNRVLLVTTTGRSVQAVALELGVPSWRLRNWIRDAKKKLERSSEITELIAAQKRIKDLEEEVLILRKAAAYFAKNLQ